MLRSEINLLSLGNIAFEACGKHSVGDAAIELLS